MSEEVVSQELTDRERRCLVVVKDYIDRTGAPPSQLELAMEVGGSTNAVMKMLMAIEEKGWVEIQRDGNGKMLPRGIVVVGYTPADSDSHTSNRRKDDSRDPIPLLVDRRFPGKGLRGRLVVGGERTYVELSREIGARLPLDRVPIGQAVTRLGEALLRVEVGKV